VSRSIYSSVSGTRYAFESDTPDVIQEYRELHSEYSLQRSEIKSNPKGIGGWRMPSSYSVSMKAVHGPDGEYINNFGTTHYGNLNRRLDHNPILFQAPLPSAGLRSRAEVGALLRLKDQSVNLAQAFGERKQTADLFSSNIGKIARSFSHLKKGRLKQAAKALDVVPPRQWPKKLPARWLELQYGWKPLLSDVWGACELLDEIPINSYVVTVSKKVREDYVEDNLYNDSRYCPSRVIVKGMTGCHVRLDYHPSNAVLERLSSVGFGNPAALAWELLPWSFVVDWAIPIGDWLSSLDAAFGYTFISGSRTEIGRQRWDYHPCKGNSGVAASRRLRGKAHLFEMRRSVYTSSPIPTLPRLKNPWSYSHAANAAALLAQVFGRK
jgi:hypothetical protein